MKLKVATSKTGESKKQTFLAEVAKFLQTEKFSIKSKKLIK